ncbi:MAG: AMP-binding protein [Lachnospiraceae bacterium]|nr:AMP-binding protein [Lachnospiraceae bacterium]
MFEGTAVKIPDKTALIACDRTLTFTRLNEEANRIAWSLLERGIKKGDSIILLLPRRSFYFSALFGVLKAGAAFIPCDPAYPSERIRLILEDCGAAFLISTKDQPQGSVLLEEKRLNIEELLKSPRSENPETEVLPEDLAYLIYTSGSTGKPKGVMIRHLGIANYCTANPANPFFDIVRSSVETMLSVTTVSFDRETVV